MVQEIQLYQICVVGLTSTHSGGSDWNQTTAYRMYLLLLRSYPGRRELVCGDTHEAEQHWFDIFLSI